MDFNSSTPRASVTIEDQPLQAIAPFAEGHRCSANEAAVLNQTLRENLRNNLASQVKKAVAEGKSADDLQAMLDAYTQTYAFGVRKASGGRTTDPVAKMAKSIARERVVAALKSKGYKVSEVAAEKINGYVAQLLAKDSSIMEIAKARVEEAKAAGADMIDLDLEDKGQAEAPAPAKAKGKKHKAA